MISPLEGISSYVPTYYLKGCDINTKDTSGIQPACKLAQSSRATILVLGLDQTQEAEQNEAGDRKILGLPGTQYDFAVGLANCSTSPLILIIMSGGPIDITFARDASQFAAILWVGYPGQAGGQAIARILFGDVSPSGRLSTTIYPESFANQVAIEDMRMRPDPATSYPGRTYRFYTGDSVYPFAYGLSYTTFTFRRIGAQSPLIFSATHLNSLINSVGYSRFTTKPLADVGVIVTNTGQRASDVSVLLFVKPPPDPGYPWQVLAGFQRVRELAPGNSTTVYFPITAHHLSIANEKGKHVIPSGKWQLVVEDMVVPLAVM